MLVVEGQQMAGGILTLWNPQVMNLLAAEATRHTLSVNMQIIGNTEGFYALMCMDPRCWRKREECS
jgi:hypothetical protein